MKTLKWLITELLGFFGAAFVLLYVVFIFMMGTHPDSIPEVLTQTVSARNLFISISHSIGYVCFMIYYIRYIKPSDFDNITIGVACVNILIYTLCMVLVWRCYFMSELEPLIFVITIYGIMLSIFVLTLSYTMYTVVDEYKRQTITLNFLFKIINFGAIMFYIAAILTYYRYVSNFVYSQFGIIMRSRDVDALALFCYIVALGMQLLSFVMSYFLDRSAEKYFRLDRKIKEQ